MTSTLFLADAAFLVNPVVPFLVVLVFAPWAWLVSSRLDKDARYYHLQPEKWAAIHLGAGGAAALCMFLIPVPLVGIAVGLLVLLGPVFAYWKHRNENVPEENRFHLNAESVFGSAKARRAAKAARDAALVFSDAKKRPVPVPDRDDEQAYALHMALEDLLGPAVEGRATALDVAVSRNAAMAGRTVDGIRYKQELGGPEAVLPIVARIKELAGLDPSDVRKRQRGTCSVKHPEGKTELTVTTRGSSQGLELRIEFDRAKQLSKSYDQLGLLKPQKAVLDKLDEMEERHGVVLVTGPVGSGVRTTILSLVGRHDSFTSIIKSLEDEVELELEGVDHVRFDPNGGQDYATNLQSFLRRDPDFVLTSEPKDAQTARAIVEPDADGPLIYTPIRGHSIEDALRTWTRLVGDARRAVKPLRVVTHQRLLRKLCPACRVAVTPAPEMAKRLNLPEGHQLHQKGGQVQIKNKVEPCPVCSGTGYLGQVAAFQVLAVDDEIRKLLAAGDVKGAMAQARRGKMIYLQEAALQKVAAGDTSIEEVGRVTAPPKQAPKPKAAAPAAG